MGAVDKDQNYNQEDSMEESIESVGEESDMKSSKKPIAAFHPSMGMINMTTKGMEMLGEGEFPKKDTPEEEMIYPEPNESQVIVHGASGPFLMEKCKWPKLVITEPVEQDAVESLTQELTQTPVSTRPAGPNTEEDMMDNLSNISKESDLEETEIGWKTSNSRKTKNQKKRRVVVASRTSNRIPRDGVPIAEKAAKRAREKNDISGISSKNPLLS